MCAALPRADYYESSALGVVRLRPSRLAQFRSGQTIRVPAFRSTTCVPLGGELYPWRCGGWAHESASHPRCVPRIQQQGVTSLAASDRSASTAIAAFGGKFPQIQRRQSLTSLSRHRHCGSPACSRWSTSGTVKTDLLMSPDQRRPIELLGPLPPVTLRGWDGISAVGRGSAGLRGALHYIIPSPPAPSRRTVAVEEPAFLVAVQRIVGGIEIENDLRRRTPMRLQEHIDEQRLDCRCVMAHLVIPRRLGAAQLQPVQRRLASRRCTVRAFRRKLAGDTASTGSCRSSSWSLRSS